MSIKIAKKKPSSPASIERFFIPDSTDAHLPSDNFIELVKALRLLVEEAENQFQTTTALPKSLKSIIHREFTHYASSQSFSIEELVHCNIFWKSIQDFYSPARAILNRFKNIYCFRLVTVYLYKIKFIATLTETIGIPLTETHLLNPNSFIGDIFKNGSSTALNCHSLKTNSYSWFRPSHKYRLLIKNLGKRLSHINVTEMFKACDYETFINQGNSNVSPARIGDHSLSHKTFGKFLNTLLASYPLWLQKKNSLSQKSQFQTLNTKFVGDALTPLAMSHWLAEENSLEKYENGILCPDFSGNDSNGGSHINICYELQFLMLLANISRSHNIDTIRFICNTINDKYSKHKTHCPRQMALPLGGDECHDLLYKRIVLNLSELPKNNPHHFLITQINNHKDALDEGGIMIVLCNQKLFVPSQADRVKNLLQDMTPNAVFHLGALCGKGEIPDFIYIFKKKDGDNYSLSNTNLSSTKKSLFTFNISGELPVFKNFCKVADALENFLMTKTSYSTPVHRQEIDDELVFEFHQDAIINGKLLGATNHIENNVPHPNFFKNLIQSCITFDQFFLVEHLNHQKRFELTNDLLGLHYSYENKYPFILIVDFSDSTKVSLEIIHSQAYKARIEKYGTAYFQYYGLLAKIPDININLFREFFRTEIGYQITQLSLDGHTSNLKSKINSLLIPKFFAQTNLPPQSTQRSLRLFKTPPKELLKFYPQDLKNLFQDSEKILASITNEHPWYAMGLYVLFKNNCSSGIEQIKGKSNTADYCNPLIIDKLNELKTYPIFDNKDIHIKVNIKDKRDIHLPLYSTFIRKEEDNTILELQSNERLSPICSFYADKELIHFIDYLLQEAKGTAISSLLQGLHIPRTTSLKEALGAYHCLQDALETIYRNCKKAVSDIFIRQISLQPPAVASVDRPLPSWFSPRIESRG